MATKKDKGLTPTTCFKSEKSNQYIYILKNGQELVFQDKIFPIVEKPKPTNSQLLIF